MLTGCLIQQTVFTASGCNMDLALTDHVMKIICIDTRCVDHRPGSDISPVCQKLPSIFQPSNPFDFCVKLKFHPIFTGMPAVGAYSAAHTSAVRFGSIS